MKCLWNSGKDLCSTCIFLAIVEVKAQVHMKTKLEVEGSVQGYEATSIADLC